MSSKILRPTIYAIPDRNKQPILDVLKEIFQKEFGERPVDGKKSLKFLEIGTCSGQHLAYFARHFSGIQFQPSDVNSSLFESVNAFRLGNGLDADKPQPQNEPLLNVNEPIIIDLTWPTDKWPIESNTYDIMYCSNVVHISPWECSIGLFSGAKHCLNNKTGILVMYGPFAMNGRLDPQSNRDFDQSLRQRNSEWGIRDIVELEKLAKQNGLYLHEQYDMPVNNKILLFKFSNQN